MKQIILLFLVLLCGSTLMAKGEKNKIVPSEIDQVTVFLKGAQVTRSVDMNLPIGRSELEFIELSNKINEESIQVTCEGDGVILDVKSVNYNAGALNVDSLMSAEEQAQVETWRKELVLLEDAFLILSEERKILEVEKRQIYNNPLLQQGTDSIRLLKEGFAFFETKYVELTKRLIALKHEGEDLQKEKNKLSENIMKIREEYQVENKNRNFSKIIITVDMEKAGKCYFELSYLVNGAFWKPSYDIRTDGIDQDLTLMYKGEIQQNTGVDWTDVNLSVSMGNPYQNNDRPKIYPEYIDFMAEPDPVVLDNSGRGNIYGNVYVNPATKNSRRTGKGGKAGYGGPEGAQGPAGPAGATGAAGAQGPAGPAGATGAAGAQGPAGPAGATGADGAQGPAGAAGAAGAQGKTGLRGGNKSNNLSQTIEGDINIIFELDRLYSIPSDYNSHTVLLKIEEVPAEYTYYAVPKKDKKAYLLAKVKDWGKLNLLKGKANLFANGTYVGQTEIDPSVLSEHLSLSLGADDKVSLKRYKLETDANTSFFGGSQTQTYNYEILVRNNRSQAINLELRDQIPLSHNEEIEVVLEQSDGAEYTKDYGSLNWKIKVEPNKNENLKFSYSVKHPSGKRLTGS